MLDGAETVETQLVAELHLLDGLLVRPELGLSVPRAGNRDLVEHGELHEHTSSVSDWNDLDLTLIHRLAQGLLREDERPHEASATVREGTLDWTGERCHSTRRPR